MSTKCEVRASLIEGAGRGLFATRAIRKNEKITKFWEGDLIEREEALRRRAAGNDSHIVALERSGRCLDCVRAPASGADLASFANAAIARETNAVKARPYNYKIARNEVWLVATRDIAPGEEIMISYGHDYWHVKRDVAGQLEDLRIFKRVKISNLTK